MPNVHHDAGNAMKFAKFGATGLTVSKLCLGTATFGKQTEEAEAQRILEKAADAGVDFIDTADGYPMGADFALVGRTEEIVGRWLKRRRGRFIVATKGGAPMGPSRWDQGTSRKHLLDAIDGSLRRLGTDYVDLYQLHFDDQTVPIDETLEALESILSAGKARHVGTSNVLAYRLARALGRSDVLGVARFASVQPRYNLLFREIERELLPLVQEENLAVIPFNPLAGGMLSGKYKFGTQPEAGRFSGEVGQFGAVYQQRYWHKREFQTIAELDSIAKSIGQPLSTLSIAWLLANPIVTSVILGASRADQLDATLAAAQFEMSADLKKRLDDLTVEFRRGDAVR
jgi:1-deoxyxylulose-5-phosphate synthase